MTLVPLKSDAMIASFSAVVALFTLYAFMFLTARRLRSTHLQALGSSWDELPRRSQTLYVVLLRELGAGWAGAALAVAWFLAIPVMRGEAWGKLAILTVVVVQSIPLLIALRKITRETGAKTQWYVPLIAVGFACLGAFL